MATITWKQVSAEKPEPNTKILIKAKFTQYESWNDVKIGNNNCQTIVAKDFEEPLEAVLSGEYNDNATLTNFTPLWKLFKARHGVSAFEFDKITEWAEWFPGWDLED
ncbi:hypothetical protein MA9V1_221 [Chryseobacterium phage MA9V-1]|nr:hypothetical protein MA9V1_221 [Chryseobacterium phage MA9V-1]